MIAKRHKKKKATKKIARQAATRMTAPVEHRVDPMAQLTVRLPAGILEGMIAAFKASDPMGVYGARRHLAPLEAQFSQWKKEQGAAATRKK